VRFLAYMEALLTLDLGWSVAANAPVTEAIAVRRLSLRPDGMRRQVPAELLTGALLGLVLGAVSTLGAWAGFGDLRLGLSVGLSILAAATMASALGSGPVATIVQDVASLAIYFIIVGALLVP